MFKLEYIFLFIILKYLMMPNVFMKLSNLIICSYHYNLNIYLQNNIIEENWNYNISLWVDNILVNNLNFEKKIIIILNNKILAHKKIKKRITNEIKEIKITSIELLKYNNELIIKNIMLNPKYNNNKIKISILLEKEKNKIKFDSKLFVNYFYLKKSKLIINKIKFKNSYKNERNCILIDIKTNCNIKYLLNFTIKFSHYNFLFWNDNLNIKINNKKINFYFKKDIFWIKNINFSNIILEISGIKNSSFENLKTNILLRTFSNNITLTEENFKLLIQTKTRNFKSSNLILKNNKIMNYSNYEFILNFNYDFEKKDKIEIILPLKLYKSNKDLDLKKLEIENNGVSIKNPSFYFENNKIIIINLKINNLDKLNLKIINLLNINEKINWENFIIYHKEKNNNIIEQTNLKVKYTYSDFQSIEIIPINKVRDINSDYIIRLKLPGIPYKSTKLVIKFSEEFNLERMKLLRFKNLNKLLNTSIIKNCFEIYSRNLIKGRIIELKLSSIKNPKNILYDDKIKIMIINNKSIILNNSKKIKINFKKTSFKLSYFSLIENILTLKIQTDNNFEKNNSLVIKFNKFILFNSFKKNCIINEKNINCLLNKLENSLKISNLFDGSYNQKIIKLNNIKLKINSRYNLEKNIEINLINSLNQTLYNKIIIKNNNNCNKYCINCIFKNKYLCLKCIKNYKLSNDICIKDINKKNKFFKSFLNRYTIIWTVNIILFLFYFLIFILSIYYNIIYSCFNCIILNNFIINFLLFNLCLILIILNQRVIIYIIFLSFELVIKNYFVSLLIYMKFRIKLPLNYLLNWFLPLYLIQISFSIIKNIEGLKINNNIMKYIKNIFIIFLIFRFFFVILLIFNILYLKISINISILILLINCIKIINKYFLLKIINRNDCKNKKVISNLPHYKPITDFNNYIYYMKNNIK